MKKQCIGILSILLGATALASTHVYLHKYNLKFSPVNWVSYNRADQIDISNYRGSGVKEYVEITTNRSNADKKVAVGIIVKNCNGPGLIAIPKGNSVICYIPDGGTLFLAANSEAKNTEASGTYQVEP